MVGDFLKPLSEPVVKLIDSISGAVGTLYEPKRIRRRAAADADAAIVLAKSQTEVDDIQFRAGERLLKREIRRQQNIESIVEIAKQELPESVNDVPVAEDWIYDFFEQCHDVSNEQMQGLWARILAGEVALPGSFSLRTLNLVKILAPHDAERFTSFCEHVWMIEATPTPVFPTPKGEEQQTKQGLKFDDFLDLQSSGLIKLGENAEYTMSFDVNPLPVSYQGQKYSLTPPEEGTTLDVGNVLLTSVGRELFPIIECKKDDELKNSAIEEWRGNGWEVVEAPLTSVD